MFWTTAGCGCPTISRSPVLAHYFVRPCWLSDFALWKKFFQNRFDIQHGCFVDGVEVVNNQYATFAADQADDGAADEIGAAVPSLREYANFGERRVIARVSRAKDRFGASDLMEVEHNFEMGMCVNAVETVCRHMFFEVNFGLDCAPIVVNRFLPGIADNCDGSHNYVHG